MHKGFSMGSSNGGNSHCSLALFVWLGRFSIVMGRVPTGTRIEYTKIKAKEFMYVFSWDDIGSWLLFSCLPSHVYFYSYRRIRKHSTQYTVIKSMAFVYIALRQISFGDSVVRTAHLFVIHLRACKRTASIEFGLATLRNNWIVCCDERHRQTEYPYGMHDIYATHTDKQ